MSLLLANGHPHAAEYSIATVWYESDLVTDRINNQMATEAVLTYSALTAVANAAFSKKGAAKGTKEFEKLLTKVRNGN